MPLGLTPTHLVLILVIALIVVGPGKLPDVGAALGKSIREFRKAATDVQEATNLSPAAPAPAPAAVAPMAAAAPAPVAPAATALPAAPVEASPVLVATPAPVPAPVEVAAEAGEAIV
jgi:TatA/E family protein of Tat protein translocase